MFENSASAVATSPVLTSEYTVAVTSSGRPIVASVAVVPGSLSQPSARPAHWTVSTMTAIPNKVSRTDWGAFFWFRRARRQRARRRHEHRLVRPEQQERREVHRVRDRHRRAAGRERQREVERRRDGGERDQRREQAGLIEEVGLAEAEHHRHRTRDGHEGDIQAAAQGKGAHQCTLGAVETQ